MRLLGCGNNLGMPSRKFMCHGLTAFQAPTTTFDVLSEAQVYACCSRNKAGALSKRSTKQRPKPIRDFNEYTSLCGGTC